MRHLIGQRLLIRLAVALALLGFLIWRIDWVATADAFREANYLFVLPAMALFLSSKLLVAQRWRLMMSNFAQPPLAPMFGTLMVASLANNVVPARIGDLIRVQVPAQRYGLSRARLAATVFATESLLDGIAFAVLGLLGLALIDLEGFPTEVFWGLLGLTIGGVIAVIPFSHLQLSRGWSERGIVCRLPERLRNILEEGVPHFIEGLAVFRSPKMGSQALLLSFAIWLLEVAMFALLGLAFDISLSFQAWMLVMIAANIVTSVPIAPSNIGAYELAIAELTIALGIAEGQAGAFAIAAHMFDILAITVVGIFSLYALRLTFADLFSLGSAPRGRMPVEERPARAAG